MRNFNQSGGWFFSGIVLYCLLLPLISGLIAQDNIVTTLIVCYVAYIVILAVSSVSEVPGSVSSVGYGSMIAMGIMLTAPAAIFIYAMVIFKCAH